MSAIILNGISFLQLSEDLDNFLEIAHFSGAGEGGLIVDLVDSSSTFGVFHASIGHGTVGSDEDSSVVLDSNNTGSNVHWTYGVGRGLSHLGRDFHTVFVNQIFSNCYNYRMHLASLF